MENKIFILVILVFIIFLVIVGLIFFKTGFVENKNTISKQTGGLRIIEDNNLAITSNVIKLDNSKVESNPVQLSLRNSGSGKTSSGGGSSGKSSSSKQTGEDETQKIEPVVNKETDVEVFVSPLESNYNKNDEFTININISTQKEIYGVEFELIFDSEILELIEINKGDFLDKDGVNTYEIIKSENNKIIFASTRLIIKTGISGQGSLAEFKFKTKNLGISEFVLKNVKITDISLEDGKFNIDVKNGKLTIF